jgi:hypothetical protein
MWQRRYEFGGLGSLAGVTALLRASRFDFGNERLLECL